MTRGAGWSMPRIRREHSRDAQTADLKPPYIRELLRQLQKFPAQQNAPDGVGPLRLFADDANNVGYVIYRCHLTNYSKYGNP